ncbi:uncharacterized protein LOC143226616 [Tachypleus tridentatus]|uniref:uncharacterized protein LOC143226616 n=1 Tax=Tachypleus tridentatus TaxID=6853 RepID=UPI003FD30299
MDSEPNRHMDLSPLWEAENEDYNYCDCPGPPPQFVIPPPSPPPSLDLCRGEHSGLQYCEMKALEAEYTHPSFYSLPVIAVVSSVVLVAILVSSFLLWKHKRKVQNFLPCKSDHQTRCDVSRPDRVPYDDMLISHHPTRLPNQRGPLAQTLTPIELFDVKFGQYGRQHVSQTNFSFSGREADSIRSAKNKEQFNSDGARTYDSDIDDSEIEPRTVASDDEFAEDELSLGEFPRQPSHPCSGTNSLLGSTGGDLCHDVESTSSVENKGIQRMFCDDGVVGRKHNSQSLERNKDGYPNEGFEKKQNYYKGKNMLEPNLAFSDDSTGVDLTHRRFVGHHSPRGASHREKGRVPGLYFTSVGSPVLLQTRPLSSPPYSTGLETGTLPSVYNPHAVQHATTQRSGLLPEGLLYQVNGKDIQSEDYNHCGPVFTIGPEDAYPLDPGFGSQVEISPLEFCTFYPLSRGRPSTSPVHKNVYSSTEDKGLFTIDGNRNRCDQTSRVPDDTVRNLDKTEKHPVPKSNIPVFHSIEDSGSYGDMRPVFDSITLCT